MPLEDAPEASSAPDMDELLSRRVELNALARVWPRLDEDTRWLLEARYILDYSDGELARELGCNKIALGHHYDDVIETILMGMLHGAQIQTMMPKLHSTNYPGMELIRPLYLVREDDIKAWRDYNGLHFIQCACKFTDTCTTCNDGQNHSKRQETKELIRELKKSNPDVEKCIFSSVENVNIDTVLAYKKDGIKHSFLDEYDNK